MPAYLCFSLVTRAAEWDFEAASVYEVCDTIGMFCGVAVVGVILGCKKWGDV